jgi:hypothetical protein
MMMLGGSGAMRTEGWCTGGWRWQAWWPRGCDDSLGATGGGLAIEDGEGAAAA